jgi:hypothetical protein
MSQHLEDIKDEKQGTQLEYVEYAGGHATAETEAPFVVSPEDDKRVCRKIDKRLLPVSPRLPSPCTSLGRGVS